ncbi:FAD-binding oxidoreductase [Roseibium sp. SCP14]|uniref:FAD-binding oxidoreductase n=1 Tax=Roseibium sp. SCP14 TaxID=3141375 RepID=UPI00333CA276
MTQSNILDALKTCLGPNGWVSAEDSEQFVSDILGKGGECLLVARPQSTEEVAALVKICAQSGIAIVPQGGNTNVCRMAVPLEGQRVVLLSLSRMNRIVALDSGANTATVEAGVLMETLQNAANDADRVFAPDWGARGTATVGGAVATNGGGLNVLRYGTTREQVLGMEVVLPDGSVWNGMRALIKDNSGYDLKHLFIGSEGTLGIITRLVFRLHPRQPVTQSMMAVLSDMTRLTEFFDLARSIGGQDLAAFELLPGLGVEKALERYPDLQRPLETRADWFLLIRFAGRESVEEPLMRLFEQGFEAGILSDAVLSSSGAQEQNLWEIREQMIPHQYFRQPLLKWDVSVPTNRIVDFLLQAEQRVKEVEPDAFCYAVGHVGDGNIHYSAFPPLGTEDKVISEIYDEVDALIWSMDGSIVAEHGVGSIFAERMRRQKSGVEYTMMQTVKQSFDPQGIMNPGKLLKTD